MLPVYKAHSFVRVLRQGGRTQPWVMLVNEGENIVPYVVKMFVPWFVNDLDAVTSEVISHRLALLFDLSVQPAAFIEIDDDFLMTIDDVEAAEHIFLKDERVKFATRLIDAPIEYQKDVFSLQKIRKMIDIDTVFAFDHLIQNRDRNNSRANFLIQKNKGFLIDHEKAFDLKYINNCLIDKELITNANRHHIFFDYLRGSWGPNKEDYFGCFIEYLRTLNVNDLKPYFDQLAYQGFPTFKHKIITDYLLFMKANWAKFDLIMRRALA